MLPEIASSTDDRRRPRASSVRDAHGTTESNMTSSTVPADVRALLLNVFTIESETKTPSDDLRRDVQLMTATGKYVASFTGRLTRDSEEAYALLDDGLAPLEYLALFREVGDQQVIHLFQGRAHPQARSWIWNAGLFAVTVLSVLSVGTEMALNEMARTDMEQALLLAQNLFGELWRGAPYAISILLILGAHELGHYFAARHHKLSVTLPYFIPAPTLIGTFGAFIQLRQPMRNRKVLLDVGAAGPLFGLLFAIPILMIGLSTARVDIITGGLLEGNSFLYALMKIITFGEFLPNGTYDVFANQLSWAGWTGLLITGLNLIPIGQLDGGHILYALVGERARLLYAPILIGMMALVFVTPVWLFWLVLLFFFGRVYATPLDNITKLDPRRRLIAILGLIVFVVTFTPIPLSDAIPAPVSVPSGAVSLGLPLVVGLVTLFTRRRR